MCLAKGVCVCVCVERLADVQTNPINKKKST